MLKRLSIVVFLSCCTTGDAFRLGLIRIPKEEGAADELVFRSVERTDVGEFGSTTTHTSEKRQDAHAKDLFHA